MVNFSLIPYICSAQRSTFTFLLISELKRLCHKVISKILMKNTLHLFIILPFKVRLDLRYLCTDNVDLEIIINKCKNSSFLEFLLNALKNCLQLSLNL